MPSEDQVPLLLQFLYAGSAPAVHAAASDRLLAWCRAFDGWLAQRPRQYLRKTVRPVWQRLAQQARDQGSTGFNQKMPWQLEPQDFEQHAAWMQAYGYSDSTVCLALTCFTSFFRWCGEITPDPLCASGFNPAAQVQHPRLVKAMHAQLLSQSELDALLAALQRDPSPLGKREYAFFLARLRTGVPLGHLQQLKWEQLEQDGSGCWVRWRAGAERCPLDPQVWHALQDWLVASGRLQDMQGGMYIFTPLAHPARPAQGAHNQHWRAGRFLTSETIYFNLKLYGRLAGIPDEKLTLNGLRLTAARLKMDQGSGDDQMRVFLDSSQGPRQRKYHLKRLPPLPQDQPARPVQPVQPLDQALVPLRHPIYLTGQETTTHGFHSRKLRQAGVDLVLGEEPHGLGEQIEGLRTLERGLQERALGRPSREAVELFKSYSFATQRMAVVQKLDRPPVETGKKHNNRKSWVEDTLKILDNMAAEKGKPLVSRSVIRDALGTTEEQALGSRRLAEEMAGLRYVLRNVLRLALDTQDTQEYINLVEIYGGGCVRLAHLLKTEGSPDDRLANFLSEQIDQAIQQVTEELGLT